MNIQREDTFYFGEAEEFERVTKAIYDHVIIQLAEHIRELAVVIDHLNQFKSYIYANKFSIIIKDKS
ncbi:1_t:CDS:2 [Funneliformis caledonium]|uniref:1_t:CDS:1 n=1 Tax=Funneliformis caledonium TaxID=1117310 RepID=A0A9N9B7C5_9GLOM|nr:1_t:CDS:2 [Funneliformis caledonium]